MSRDDQGSQDAGYVSAVPNQLRDHFLGLGVSREGGRWPLRRLEDVSERVTGHKVSDTTWRDAIVLVPVGGARKALTLPTLQAMADTLIYLGARTNVELITQFSLADSGKISPGVTLKSSVDPTDIVRSVVVGSDLTVEGHADLIADLIAAQPDATTRRAVLMDVIARQSREDQRAITRLLVDLMMGDRDSS